MRNGETGAETDIGKALAGFGLFASLDARILDRLAAVSRRASWAQGSHVFYRDDDGDHMIALTSGRIRLSLGSAQGRELVIRHVTEGEILGELALMDGEPRSADARVIEASTGIVIPRAGFLNVAHDLPELGLTFARHLSRLLRNTNFQMESIAIYDLQMRVVRFFLMSLRQVHGPDLPDEAPLQMGLNQTDLSAILGASRPKVNRVLQDLLAVGALRRDGGTWVCIVPRLAEIEENEGIEGAV